MSVEAALERLIRQTEEFRKQTEEFRKQTEEFRQVSNEQQMKTERGLEALRISQQQTDEQMKKTDERLNRLLSRTSSLESRWGRFVEALVRPCVLIEFQKRGIEVTSLHQRVEVNSKDGRDKIEIDILAVNDDVVVAIEVKTTLHADDVREHMEKRLKRFHEFFPIFRGKKLYGAVAYIDLAQDADIFARKQGLFVLTLTGDELVVIKNDADFKPRDFMAHD